MCRLIVVEGDDQRISFIADSLEVEVIVVDMRRNRYAVAPVKVDADKIATVFGDYYKNHSRAN